MKLKLRPYHASLLVRALENESLTAKAIYYAREKFGANITKYEELLKSITDATEIEIVPSADTLCNEFCKAPKKEGCYEQDSERWLAKDMEIGKTYTFKQLKKFYRNKSWFVG